MVEFSEQHLYSGYLSSDSKPDVTGKCQPQTPLRCERADSTAKVDADKDLKTRDCDTGDANEHTPGPPPPPQPPCVPAKDKPCPPPPCPNGSKLINDKCLCPAGLSPLNGKCPPPPPLKKNCHYDNDYSGNVTCVIIIQGHTKEIHQSTSSNNIVVLPSKPTDFANKDPSTLTVDFVHATGPDTIGNYYVKGEVMSTTPALNNLKITAHWFDSSNKLIGVTFAYADELILNFGDRSTFSVLADGHSDLTGIPKSVELSYDWQ